MRGRRLDLAILALALLVRGIHLAGQLRDPLFDQPVMDPRFHHEWALRIAGGEWLAGEPFFRAPLYPYFLAAIYAVSGASILAARSVQLVLGALAPLLVLRIGRRTLGHAAGVWAAVIWAVYPLALRFDGDLLLEGPFLLLAMATLLGQLRALERPTRGAWFATGLLAGLAAITRPNILAYVVLVPLGNLLARGWRGRRAAAGDQGRAAARGRRGRTAPPAPGERSLDAPFPRGRLSFTHETLLLAAGVLVPILPVAAHNLATGDPVPIATQAGVNFYIGNNPQSDGFTAIVPGTRATWWGGFDDAVALAEKARGRPLAASEVSDYWLGEGLRFVTSRPAAAARLFARKLYLFWWGAELSNNDHIYYRRNFSLPMRLTLGHRVLYVPFGIAAPLGLVGLVLAAARRRRAAPLVVYVLAYMGSVVLFFVCSRFRYPVVPIAVLFAVFAVLEIGRDLHRRGARVAIGAVLLLAILLNADVYGLNPVVFGSQALSYIDLGAYQARRGRYEEALESLEQAARLDPGHPAAPAWIGVVYLKTGRYEEAERSLRLATRGDPVLFRDVVAQAAKDLGRVYLRTGRPAAALQAFESALSVRPDYALAALGAGLAARELGKEAAARAHLERVLELEPANATARQELERLPADGGGEAR